MLVELLLSPIFFLVKAILGLFPEIDVLPSFLTDTINLLKGPLSIFPSDLWKLIFINLAFWVTVHFTWAIVEWVYKKIPGVN